MAFIPCYVLVRWFTTKLD